MESFFFLQSYCSPSPENNFPWDFTASNLDWSMCIWPNAMHLYIRLRKSTRFGRRAQLFLMGHVWIVWFSALTHRYIKDKLLHQQSWWFFCMLQNNHESNPSFQYCYRSWVIISIEPELIPEVSNHWHPDDPTGTNSRILLILSLGREVEEVIVDPTLDTQVVKYWVLLSSTDFQYLASVLHKQLNFQS